MRDIKSGRRFFSIVYEITNPDAFQATAEFATNQQANELVSHGAKVTACGWGDYATAYDALEHHVRANGYDADDLVDDYVQEQELNVTSRDITG